MATRIAVIRNGYGPARPYHAGISAYGAHGYFGHPTGEFRGPSSASVGASHFGVMSGGFHGGGFSGGGFHR